METEEAREAERKSRPSDSTPFGYAQGKQDKPFRPPLPLPPPPHELPFALTWVGVRNRQRTVRASPETVTEQSSSGRGHPNARPGW